jgi:bacillithiol system protein YtxJ
MGLFSKHKTENKIDWVPLTDLNQLDEIAMYSNDMTVIIFKHSIRCSISMMAKNRLDSTWTDPSTNVKLYYLDLIKFRPISNEIENRFGIKHESPQILLIKNGKCTFSVTHGNINSNVIQKAI